jgi:hypothetical protein
VQDWDDAALPLVRNILRHRARELGPDPTRNLAFGDHLPTAAD